MGGITLCNKPKSTSFNIIDPSDDFSPDALNDNAQKLEAALNTHEAAVDAAMTQHKSETSITLAQQAETVVQAREQNCLFKLGGPTTLAAPGGDITFSLSGVDMSQYAALLLVHTVNTTALTSDLYLNGQQITTLVKTSGYYFGSVAYTVIINQPVRNCIGVQTFYLYGLNDNATPKTNGIGVNSPSWSGITSLQLTSADFAVLYGLKK